MNGIPGRSLLPGAAMAALLVSAAPVAFAGTGQTPVGLTRAREARFEIVKTYRDGPWLMPTLDMLRSELEWDSQMAAWQTEQRVVGHEAAPSIDWKHQSIVVLSLGSQFGQIGVTVNKCEVEGDLTILDLHFDIQDQWDPFGEPSHPAVLVAVERSDLKNIEIRCDASVEGLPPGLARKVGLRVNGAGSGAGMETGTGTTEVAAAPGTVNVTLGRPTPTTWGRVKAAYVVSR